MLTFEFRSSLVQYMKTVEDKDGYEGSKRGASDPSQC